VAHEWDEDEYPKVAEWGIRAFSPGDLRKSSEPVLGWLIDAGWMYSGGNPF
jgi:arginase